MVDEIVYSEEATWIDLLKASEDPIDTLKAIL
ncbi:MAG: hypothetical protein M2R45_02685 [Verrucomicrobia subdivision 3 bacterium]|nr:hypothetical protein [Limisphaerales bacterium]MCS1414061.1 hypothetical protein [Limisphaerales bacterium]